MRPHSSPCLSRTAAALALALMLSACGGDDAQPTASTQTVEQGTAAPAVPNTPAPQPDAASTVVTACSNCAALDAHTYAGAGIGVWQHVNDTNDTLDVPVRIDGLTGQDVTLVFANTTGTAQPMPPISLTATRQPWQLDRNGASVANASAASIVGRSMHDAIGEFNRRGWVDFAGERTAQPGLYRSVQPVDPGHVGDSRTWYHSDNTARTATLMRQAQVSDGTTVNLWVEADEWAPSRIGTTLADTLMNAFVPAGRIYDILTAVGGPLWGPHNYTNLLSGNGRPIDIVILNFDRNGEPFGDVGYFFSRNAIKRTATENLYGNDSISLYLDSETLYLGGAQGVQNSTMTLAHEGMHMQNFYRRGVLHGWPAMYDSWLEEGTAMMIEDFAAEGITPGYSPLADVRYLDYVARREGSYNCSLVHWTPFTNTCESYSVSGSFGAFLNRQLGLGFYKTLLYNVSSPDTLAVLDAAIREAVPGSGFADQWRKFSVTAAGMMVSPFTAGYGFPERFDGGFHLNKINPLFLQVFRTYVTTLPAAIQPYASVPILRLAVKGSFTEVVKVPPGITLSIIVQDFGDVEDTED
ncbi:hemagglutinin [Cupriavidus pauculus]|uniref:Hemagglutinin n=1 Tax=Cupriavidus pauculus TaxID=82633 RepID=A0A5P2H8N5_9BURK|nr:hemagglutinin [Cupriavidus pauculus]QET04422.1 hemagglutinin [Cupriavidus pauculus]